MNKIPITRRMLVNGMQGRIKLQEINRYNKEVDKFNTVTLLQKQIQLERKKNLMAFPDEQNVIVDEDMQILKEPKLRRIRNYRGWA
ncbi:MAG TPA: hypothetical protein ENG87_05830 [Candidatus Pacearchaeota archaeon]|nr:hypothetical protein BMS3Abin17_00084 [archaeon BMS3Abin17]HDK42875.1 hypothetical protein [Candidatus Pacearchaeota archaeon]HDZ60168.1 hypothetical protein [Candidatus Pacearchaeota archaeon]